MKNCFAAIIKLLHREKLFYAGQYGLREDHSTEIAATELIDRVISALDEKSLPFNVFMDLSKAFDNLDHQILRNKLQHYGIRGTPLNWLESKYNAHTNPLPMTLDLLKTNVVVVVVVSLISNRIQQWKT